MLWLAAFLAWLHGGMVAFDEKNSQYRTSVSHLPEMLRFDEREKSFSGQDYTHVRLPYGGNPFYEKHVADVTMIDTPEFQQSYQMNIRNLQILTEDYRLDDQFMTPANNYLNYHLPEATFSKINDYWKKRRDECGGQR